MTSRVSYDPAKREWTLSARELDFADATEVFDGLTAEIEDMRKANDREQTRFAPYFGL
jgi:uncharacterized DUF497 family protein